MADEIVTRYKLDISQYEQAVATIKRGGDDIVTSDQKVSNSLEQVGKTTAAAFSVDKIKKFTTTAAKELQTLDKQAQKTGKAFKDTAKETDNFAKQGKTTVSALQQLRNNLKSNQAALLELAAAGRTSGKLYKALSDEAGVLRGKMGDLNAEINLQTGSAFENLSGSLAGVREGLLGLNFEKVNTSLAVAGNQIGKIDFKTFREGITGALGGVAKLGAAILTSPIFLIGAAIAGIIAYIADWITSESDLEKQIRESGEAERIRFEETDRGYQRAIDSARRFGKNTTILETEQAKNKKKNIQESLRLNKLEQQAVLERLTAIERANFAARGLSNEQIISETSSGKELVETRRKLLLDLKDIEQEITDLPRAERAKQRAEAKKQEEQDAKEAESRAKERAAELLAVQKELRDSRIRLIKDEQEREIAEINAGFDDKIAAIKHNSAIEIALREQLETEREQKIRDVRNKFLQKEIDDLNKKNQATQKKIEEERHEELKKDEDFFIIKGTNHRKAEEDLALDLELQRQEDILNRRKNLSEKLAIAAAELQGFANFGNDILNLGKSFAALALSDERDQAEAQKAFAVFQTGLDLAVSLGNIIKGASEAAAATGPAAPFTLLPFILSGTAAVFGAFAQIKSILSQDTPKFAEGTPYVTGGERGKDSVHAMLMPGERVVTTKKNMQYWDELNAIDSGKFDEFINYKYIQPALERALYENKEYTNKSFAENVANALVTGKNWKGDNIVMQLIRNNNNEKKRHNDLINTLSKRQRINLRKK